jgi:hypothetical protein
VAHFKVESAPEIYALYRVFREAKFSVEPYDDEIADSPLVNAMFLRVVEAIVEQSVKEDDHTAKERWARWLAIDASRDEWYAALRRAAKVANWSAMGLQEKSSRAQDILCPFACSPDLLAEFVAEVDARVAA